MVVQEASAEAALVAEASVEADSEALAGEVSEEAEPAEVGNG